jgi:succinyl-diaminopimelate desuccinylase
MNESNLEARLVGLLSELTAFESPYFCEEQIMDFTYKWLSERELAPQLHCYREEKITNFSGVNVHGNLRGKRPGPKIVLNGHLDTVALCSGWSKDPFSLTRDGDKLYGLGALDMKSGCAANMIALDTFVHEHPDFKGEIAYSFVSDEEGPYGLGTDALINDGLLTGDIAIVTEPSASFCGKDFPCLALGARGGISYKVELTGQAAHAACPEQGVSATEDAAAIICELRQTPMPEDSQLGRGSLSVLEISGGGAACSVAEKAAFTAYRHIVRGESEASIREEVAAAVLRSGARSAYTMTFRPAPGEDNAMFYPYVIDENSPWSKKIIGSMEKASQAKVALTYFNSIGDFNSIAVRAGIPTYVFGPAGGNFHAADEYVEVSSLIGTCKCVYQILEDCLL